MDPNQIVNFIETRYPSTLQTLVKKGYDTESISTNVILLDAINTKWNLPIFEGDLHRLGSIFLHGKKEDKVNAELYLEQIYDIVIANHETLPNRFINMEIDKKYDILMGMASCLNIEDIIYFIDTPWNQRSEKMNAVANSLFDIHNILVNKEEQFINKDGYVENINFVLSKKTIIKYINYLETLS